MFIGRTDAEAETPILWPPDEKSWLIGKDPDAGRDWGQEEKGMTEDEMAGWHHRLDGHEFEWTQGVGNEQGSLACCNSWGRKESDTPEQLNWTELMIQSWYIHLRPNTLWVIMMGIYSPPASKLDLPGDSVVKTLFANAGEVSSIPELGLSWRRKWQPTPLFLPGKSHVQNWQTTVHVVTRSWKWLSDWTKLLFSCQVMSDYLWSHDLQHARLPCPSLSPSVCPDSHPWVSDAIQPSHPLLPHSPPALSLSQHQGCFHWVSSSYQVAKVL